MSLDVEQKQSMQTDFAIDIYRIITSGSNGRTEGQQCDGAAANVLISPLLLEALLSLLYLGSDGATAEELRQRLQLKRFGSDAKMANYYAATLEAATRDAATNLQLNCKILLDEQMQIADEFQKIAQKYFQFQLGKTKDTNGAGEGEVVAVKPAASALAICMVELKFKWFLPFSAYRSGVYDFHATTTTTKTTTTVTHETNETATTAAAVQTIPMLFDDDMFVKFGEFRDLDARAIELPFEQETLMDEELCMLLLLPNKRDGLAALEQQLPQVNLLQLAESGMQMESVQVLLPKFQIDFEVDVRPALEQLDIKSIFSKGANFKNLLATNATTTELRFDSILHKVRLQVNESGSEGTNAPVYKPIVISNSINAKQKYFRADHPFYFAVRSGDATYFAGHITGFKT